MMPLSQIDFKVKSAEVLNDKLQKSYLQKTKQQYKNRSEKITEYFSDVELAKNRATLTKWKATENLDKYLIEFEANCIKSGIKVLWALDMEQAHNELMSVVTKHEIKNLFTGDGFLFDEIALDDFVEKSNSLKKINLSQEKNSKLKSFIREENNSTAKNQIENIYNPAYAGALMQQANFIIADSGAIAFLFFANAIFEVCHLKLLHFLF